MKPLGTPPAVVAALAIAGLALGAPALRADEIRIPDGKATVHNVVQGDTLWDIAQAYLEDPFTWPKIWRDNDQVLNPDLIYPGGRIRIPVALLKPELREAVEAKAIEVPVPTGTLNPVLVESAGFIVKDLEDVGRVLGTYENHTLMGEGDPVFLKLRGDAAPGARFLVVRPVRTVRYPHSLRSVGKLVHVMGVVEVNETSGKTVRGTVTRFYDYILAGDRLVPYERPDVAFGEGTPPVDGMVVASWDERSIVAAHDILYLDKGARDGLAPGMVVEVAKIGEEIAAGGLFGGIEVPGRALARLRILSVREGNATAWVEQSDAPIRVGDVFHTPAPDAATAAAPPPEPAS